MQRRLERTIAIIISIFALATCIILLTKESYNSRGYEYLFLLPGIFSIYYPRSNLSKIRLRNLPVTMLRITLFIRVVITPFVMATTDVYSTGFYATTRITTLSERTIATFLFLFEFIAIIITAELCIKKIGVERIESNESDENISETIKPIPNTLFCWICALIGIVGYLIFPVIAKRVYFITGNDEVVFEYMTFVPALVFEFTKITFLLLLIISVNQALKQKQRSTAQKPSVFIGLFILIFATLLIGVRMTNNRMNIIRNTFFCLELLILVYPRRKKTILIGLGVLSASVVLSVSAFKWLGTSSGNTNFNIISNTFGYGGESKFLQMYFNGVDGIAYGVSLKETTTISFRVFINDTLRNVVFLNQLITNGDTTNTPLLYNQSIYGISSRLGVIIPMVTQCSMHLGYILSPLYSIICVYMLFYACRKRQEANSFYQFFLWFGIALEFGSFQGYNYSLVIANITNNILLPYLIMRTSSHIVFKLKRL